jgi:hypothetical protein
VAEACYANRTVTTCKCYTSVSTKEQNNDTRREEDAQKIGEETRLIPLYLKHDSANLKYWLSTTILPKYRSRDGSVSTATGYGPGRPGFDSRHGKILSLLQTDQTNSGAHPISYPMGTKGDFPCGNAAGSVKLATPI